MSILGFFKKTDKTKINYHLLDRSVVLNFGGKTHVINKGDVRFEQIVKAIKSGNLAEIPELVDTSKSFKKYGYDLVNGVLFKNGEELPDALGRRVIALIDANMPIDIISKFWDNLKQNPSFNARQMLYKFLEHNGHPLTEDGCFIAYRGVTEDFKDPHTKTFNNSVGSVCEMSREQVDDNPNNTCSRGLHVACYDYAKGFGAKLIEVKVNPRDVVAVPVDYNGTKMRVCRFEVVALGEKLLTAPVYIQDEPSNYDTDEDLDEDFDQDEEF